MRPTIARDGEGGKLRYDAGCAGAPASPDPGGPLAPARPPHRSRPRGGKYEGGATGREQRDVRGDRGDRRPRPPRRRVLGRALGGGLAGRRRGLAVAVAAHAVLEDAAEVLADAVQARMDGQGPAEAARGLVVLAEGEVAEALPGQRAEVLGVEADDLLAVGDGGGVVLGQVARGRPLV